MCRGVGGGGGRGLTGIGVVCTSSYLLHCSATYMYRIALMLGSVRLHVGVLFVNAFYNFKRGWVELVSPVLLLTTLQGNAHHHSQR